LLSIGAPTVLLIERRRLRWALFAVVGAAVLWSSSRNSIVTMAVLVLVAAAARGAQARMRPLVGAAAGAAALAVVVLTPLVVSNPASFTNRGLIWQQSLLAWADNPLFGLGSNWYATQLTSSSVIASSVTQGHNQFIHALTTGGAVLVLLTAALCGALLLSAARSAARGSLFGVWYVVAYFASFWLEPGLTFADQDYAFPVTIVPIAFVLFAQADESDDEPASAAEREGPARRAPALARIARHLAARQPAARQPAGRQPAGRQPAERQPERQPAARQLADR
ncbi:MAG: O-antigen ligase family protein, partial [Frankiaceae bacterium]|nr:O-antigen ligase family protein [Frankiaceae bacterium]